MYSTGEISNFSVGFKILDDKSLGTIQSFVVGFLNIDM